MSEPEKREIDPFKMKFVSDKDDNEKDKWNERYKHAYLQLLIKSYKEYKNKEHE